MSSENQFKSKLKNTDKVKICFNGGHDVFTGWVTCVHFYVGQIKYDVEIRFPDGSSTTIKEIDSGFVREIKEHKTGL